MASDYERKFAKRESSATSNPQTGSCTIGSTPSQQGGPFHATQLWNEIVECLRREVCVKRRRISRRRVHDQCFSGADAVDVVHRLLRERQTQFSTNEDALKRDKAIKLCQLMVTFGVIEPMLTRRSTSVEQFEDSSSKLYRFTSDDVLSSEDMRSGDDLDAGSVSDDVFLSGKPRTKKLCDDDVVSLDESVIGNQGALLMQQCVGVPCRDVPTWKRCSAESLRRWLPSPTQCALGRRTSLPVFAGFDCDIHTEMSPPSSDDKSSVSSAVQESPPSDAVAGERDRILREVALSCLLQIVEVSFLDGIANVATSSITGCDAGSSDYPKLTFKNPLIASNRPQDTWWTLALDCLESFPCDADVLNLTPAYGSEAVSTCGAASEKLSIFRRLSDLYSRRATSAGPLWPDCFIALHIELYRLLMADRRDDALRAAQLAVVLLDRCTSAHLRRLLVFLRCAASDSQASLSSEPCNRNEVESSFSGSIIRNKLMAPHQSGQLVMFLVDYAHELFEVPADVVDMVCRRLHAAPDTLVVPTFCVRVSASEFARQSVVETETAIVALTNATLDDTRLTLREKRRHLRLLARHHADVYQKHFSDMV